MISDNPYSSFFMSFIAILRKLPHAVAVIEGSDKYAQIHGEAQFYQTRYGVLVACEVAGLPMAEEICRSPVFAFHIHEGEKCSGNQKDLFADAGTHFNPNGCVHPYHAGDLPPLFGNNGYALQIFLTDRFAVHEVIGKTIIIHANPDDFTTQPAGNSGEKIACGQIKEIRQENIRSVK